MPVRLGSAAGYFCYSSGWSLTNLRLQRLLYLAQVDQALHYEGAPLIREPFEAGENGPVVPLLYRELEMFGNDPVTTITLDGGVVRNFSTSMVTLMRVWGDYGASSDASLIALTRWDYGAWKKRYEPEGPPNTISQDDIVEEASNRVKFAASWNEQSRI